MLCFSNISKLKLRKVLEKIRMVFWKIGLQHHIYQIIERVHAKTLEVTLLFVDFTKAFDSLYRVKMEQILQAYSLPEETVTAIIMLYRNMNVKVRSPHRDTNFFDILAGVLRGDTLAPYLFIICSDYIL